MFMVLWSMPAIVPEALESVGVLTPEQPVITSARMAAAKKDE
jgi:hypothetical protein